MIHVLILCLAMFSHTADYSHHVWYHGDHVIGYARAEDSTITTPDGWTVEFDD